MNERRKTPGVAAYGLAKTYKGGAEALRGVTFEVAPGESFGLLGPNGAGKTTTIGILTTTVRPTAGEAFVAGFDVVHQPLSARSASGIVFQDSVVDRALSGRANLLLHARLWRVPTPRASGRIEALVELMGLGDIVDRPVQTYSGGQRRRLEIARSVLAEPAVLFMDEPTVGLDPAVRHDLWSLVAGLRADAATTLMLTTHYLDEAERLCDRIAILHRGEIVAMDSPASLLAKLGEEILEIDGDVAGARETLAAAGIPLQSSFEIGSTLTVPFYDGLGDRAVGALRDASLTLHSISVRRPTLDDVYLRLTGATLEG